MHDGPGQHFSHQGVHSADVDVPSRDFQDAERAAIGALRCSPMLFRDERFAPEVDRDLLFLLVQGKLNEPQARLIFRLVESFRNWFDAYIEILVVEAKRSHEDERSQVEPV